MCTCWMNFLLMFACFFFLTKHVCMLRGTQMSYFVFFLDNKWVILLNWELTKKKQIWGLKKNNTIWNHKKNLSWTEKLRAFIPIAFGYFFFRDNMFTCLSFFLNCRIYKRFLADPEKSLFHIDHWYGDNWNEINDLPY